MVRHRWKYLNYVVILGRTSSAGSSVMENTDGQATRRLSFESWLDESKSLVGSSAHGFITPKKTHMCLPR
jgi:hypothetical protein